MGYHQLRMVGRYWSRRYADLRGTFIVPSEMENGDQPICRSDDHLCGIHGGYFPIDPHGSSLGWLLDASITEPLWFSMG